MSYFSKEHKDDITQINFIKNKTQKNTTLNINSQKTTIRKTIIKRKFRKRRVPIIEALHKGVSLQDLNKIKPKKINKNEEQSILCREKQNFDKNTNNVESGDVANNKLQVVMKNSSKNIEVPQLPPHHDKTPIYSFSTQEFPKNLLLNPNRTLISNKVSRGKKDNSKKHYVFTDIFDHVFVINSLNQHSSWLHIIKELQTLGETNYERIPLVNGSKTIYNNKWNSGRRSKQMKLLNEFEVSILETIYQIVNTAIRKKYKTILILQDSITFLKNTPKILKLMETTLPKIWKILFLGCCQNSWIKIHPARNFGYFANESSMGLFAFALHNSIYSLFLQLLKYRYNSWLYDLTRKYKNQCVVLKPNIAISIKPNLLNISEKLRWNLNLYNRNQILALPITQKPLISIILTSYNSENTIFHAIQSLSIQTYNFIEIIIVDDHSTDKTIEIVEQCMKKDPRIYLIKNNHNYGVFISRNIGIKYSHGYYITFQDADDLSTTRRIDTQVKAIEKNKKYQGCIGRYIDKITQKYSVCSPTLMIRRDVIDYVGYFDSVRVGADEEYRKRIEQLGLTILPIKQYLYTCYDRLIEANGKGNPYSILLSKKYGHNTDIQKIYSKSYKDYHIQLKKKENIKEKKFYIHFPIIQSSLNIQHNFIERRSFNIQYDNYEHLQKFMEPQLSIETLQQLSKR